MLRDRRFYLYLLYVKLGLLVLFCFSPPVLPHMLRQVDTMAISLRYWLRWTVELETSYPLIPAYLAEGDSYAIQFMEFPILNLILAPLFSFGIYYGRVLNNFFFIAINLGLTYLAYRTWKGKRLGEVDAGDAFYLLPFIAAAGSYFYKHIPDYTAFILITYAVGISFDEKRKNFLLSFVLCAVGALIKPPQVVALAPLLLHPNRKFIIQSIVKWIIPAGIPCIVYYTYIQKQVLKLADTGMHFGAHIRNPLDCLVEFFTEPGKILTFLQDAYFGKIVAWPVFAFGIYYFYKHKKISPLVGLLLLQTLGLVLLDGNHLFVHRYYHTGFAFVAALAFTRFTALSPRWVALLAFIVLAGTNLERTWYDIRPVFTNNIYKQCEELKANTPEFPWGKDYRFRSGFREDPTLGLCFGEREGSYRSEFGFALKKDHFPEACTKLKESKDIILMKCTSEPEFREELRF